MTKLDEALLDSETRCPDLCPSSVIREAARSYAALLKLAPEIEKLVEAFDVVTKDCDSEEWWLWGTAGNYCLIRKGAFVFGGAKYNEPVGPYRRMNLKETIESNDSRAYGFIVGAIVARACQICGVDSPDSIPWAVDFANKVAKAWADQPSRQSMTI